MKNIFKNKRLAILGFGLEGKDLVRLLMNRSAEITVFDQREKEELDLESVNEEKIQFVCGKAYLSQGLLDFDYIFRSPGVYRFIPEIVEAEKGGVEVSSAMRLFFDLCSGKIIGVTGTKGKGTTSTLIYKILKSSGKNVYLAGNIGEPYLELIPKLNKSSWVVLEISSFQLIDLHESPHISVVLNITSDHLDWHKNRKEYIEAKTNILKYQKKNGFAVLNSDYDISKNFAKHTKGKVFYFSKRRKINGSFVEDNKINLLMGEEKYQIGSTKDLLLRGKHNWENITAAVCASRLAGAKINAIKKAVFSFKGLEHRLELVGKTRGISFYNDSFSTNPQPLIAAINSFDEPITLILGGSDKGLDYTEMAREIAKKKNVERVVLIGQISPKIRNVLKKAKYGREIIFLGKRDMKKIVNICIKETPRGGIVLLSPATASFDMFENYKDRGNQFKQAVKSLKSKHGKEKAL